MEQQAKGGDVVLKSQRTQNLQTQSNVPSPEKTLNTEIKPSAPIHNSFSTNHGSNLNVRNVSKPYNRLSSLRARKVGNKEDDDGLESDDPIDTNAEK